MDLMKHLIFFHETNDKCNNEHKSRTSNKINSKNAMYFRILKDMIIDTFSTFINQKHK